ncbi:NAD(P)-dependent oxidoreductase [Alteromonas sp. ASW11-36]|uniref:NAD(P)-dependent oxidoreductase n=1 Tax=Alteromonas arenosi TaxID=3055817 RepID=A0ABT7SZR5_9ALTE|nr:NAD(P)-dependent oxidoreductase [Alteromonas sp. ASW11-36]MDM7861029.1 NAD(P)-dependent oxidoreductase [Alteromonas sp. ASW11-36]
MTINNVAFVGLGVMGYPMAGHLANAGLSVKVYNRTYSKAQAWMTEYKGSACKTPREAAADAELILVCVGNDDDVRSVMYGDDGVLAGASENAIVVDHTTASAELAVELEAACAKQQVGFLDAPVSGGQAGAENGVLTVMMGGQRETYDKVEQTLQHFARCVRLIGDIGAGQQAKMMNQICIAGVVQGLAEALHFGQCAGLDCQAVIDTISQGAAQSWQMENRAKTMLAGEYDFGFAVDWMRKDLKIALDNANQVGARLPLTALVDQFYADVQAMGGGRNDTSSLLRRFK